MLSVQSASVNHAGGARTRQLPGLVPKRKPAGVSVGRKVGSEAVAGEPAAKIVRSDLRHYPPGGRPSSSLNSRWLLRTRSRRMAKSTPDRLLGKA